MQEWFEINKLKIITGIVIFVLVIYFLFFRIPIQEEIIMEDKATNEEIMSKPIENVSDISTIMMVDVKGAVKKPGVYRADKGERVIDLIDRAGGFLKEADSNQVNLSQHIQDEMVIFVPMVGAGVEGTNLSQPATSQNNSLLNINIATEVELQSLPGIGPSKAASIIAYREENGGFSTIEDIKKISGIGDKTFEKLQPLISIK